MNTETKVQPTPTPWRVESVHWNGQIDRKIVSAKDGVIAIAPDGISEERADANAALIVKCVNSYEELLGLLKGTLDYYEIQGLTGPAQLVRQAIAKTEAQS